jgi:hypothetical protein
MRIFPVRMPSGARYWTVAGSDTEACGCGPGCTDTCCTGDDGSRKRFAIATLIVYAIAGRAVIMGAVITA